MGGEVREQGLGVRHRRPVGEVIRAAELTSVLSSPFRVVGGQVSLAGCLLEDVPFLESRGTNREPVWFDHWGRRVTDAFAASLRLGQTEEIERAPVAWGPQELSAWQARIAEQSGMTVAELPSLRVIWCKWARGKLAFRVGDVGAELPFEGWAQSFLDGTRRPPSWKCPVTGQSGDEFVLTDDGELTVSQAVHRCERSGRMRLETHLELVSLGRWLSSEYVETCPLTQVRCEPESMVACRQCGGRLAGVGLQHGLCPLCRETRRLPPASRWAQWLGRHTRPAQISQWRIAEGGGRVVLMRAGWLAGEVWLLAAATGRVLHHRRRKGWGRWREAEKEFQPAS